MDPDGVLAKYLKQKHVLHAGRTPRTKSGSVTVKELVNAFLNPKGNHVDNGERSPHG